MLTNHRKTVDFNEIDVVLERLGVIYAASESHGVLCGLLCVKGFVSYDEWKRLLHDEQKAQPTWNEEDLSREVNGTIEHRHSTGVMADDWGLLQDLYEETLRQLSDDDYGFSLLLPDDEQPLRLRTQALVGRPVARAMMSFTWT